MRNVIAPGADPGQIQGRSRVDSGSDPWLLGSDLRVALGVDTRMGLRQNQIQEEIQGLPRD